MHNFVSPHSCSSTVPSCDHVPTSERGRWGPVPLPACHGRWRGGVDGLGAPDGFIVQRQKNTNKSTEKKKTKTPHAGPGSTPAGCIITSERWSQCTNSLKMVWQYGVLLSGLSDALARLCFGWISFLSTDFGLRTQKSKGFWSILVSTITLSVSFRSRLAS